MLRLLVGVVVGVVVGCSCSACTPSHHCPLPHITLLPPASRPSFFRSNKLTKCRKEQKDLEEAFPVS